MKLQLAKTGPSNSSEALSFYNNMTKKRHSAYPGFYSMKRVGYLYSSLDGMLVPHRVTSSIYIWVERGTVRVQCLPQKHNATARALTRTALSRVERINHDITASSTHYSSNLTITPARS